MAATADPGTVGEQPLAAAVVHVHLQIAGERLAERPVVGRHIAVRRAGDGEHHALVTSQQRLLNGRQDLVGEAVEAAAELLRLGTGNRLVVAIEQVAQADPAALDRRLELPGDLPGALASQVVDALVIVVQGHRGQLLADRLGQLLQLHRLAFQATGLLVAGRQVAAHLAHRFEQAAELAAIVVRAGGDFADLLFHADRQGGDAVQMLTGTLDLGHAGDQLGGQAADLLDHLAGLALDLADHLANLGGRRRGAPGQAAHLAGHHGETAAVLAGAGGLDRRVERQQVGLAGDRLDHPGDPLDLRAAPVQLLDQRTAGAGLLTQLLHAADGVDQHAPASIAALPRLDGGFHRLATERRSLCLGGDHHLGIADDASGGIDLRLYPRGQVLHRIGHTGGRQGVVTDRKGQLAGQLVDIDRDLPALTAGAHTLPGRCQPGQHQQQSDAQPERPPALRLHQEQQRRTATQDQALGNGTGKVE
ncbi:hypothetical protein D9M71_150920 [compost metagenome]